MQLSFKILVSVIQFIPYCRHRLHLALLVVLAFRSLPAFDLHPLGFMHKFMNIMCIMCYLSLWISLNLTGRLITNRLADNRLGNNWLANSRLANFWFAFTEFVHRASRVAAMPEAVTSVISCSLPSLQPPSTTFTPVSPSHVRVLLPYPSPAARVHHLRSFITRMTCHNTTPSSHSLSPSRA